MQINQSTFFKNYKERMKRLALYEPLIALQNKNTKDISNHKIDMYDLGLLTLLFFYECKLIRKKDVGIEELSTFLYETIHERYNLDSKKSDSIAVDIIRSFRPASGKRLSKTFYDWESKQEYTIYYSILKAGKSDLVENKQYYELDEDGLELIFSTREYYSEFQLSINQMLLRKQLEKGEFSSALRQIDEMYINVESLHERIVKIKNDINRNVISEEVYMRYEQLIDDIHQRLEYESKEFNELKSFVRSALNDLKFKQHSGKDGHIYSNALQVSNALDLVHKNHDGLLEKCINIQTTALMAAKESLYYSGVESFNFNKEIVSYCIAEATPLEIVKTIAKPFLSLEKCEKWTPLAIFFPQRIYRKDKGDVNLEFIDVSDKEEDKVRVIEMFYERMMALCIKEISETHELLLSDLIASVKQSQPELLNLRSFYDFWITVHQFSPIEVYHESEDRTHNILVEAIKHLHNRYKRIHVVELNDVLKVNEDFKISNMKMTLEEKYEI